MTSVPARDVERAPSVKKRAPTVKKRKPVRSRASVRAGRAVWIAASVIVVSAIAFGAFGVMVGGGAPTVAAQVVLSLAGLGGAAVAWKRNDRQTFVAILVAGLVARFALLPLDPVFSNDVYRYLWDGRDLLHGVDPYVTLPSAPGLASMRAGDWLYPHIDWSDVPTLYPPFLLGLYALGAAIDANHVVAIKAVLLAGDLGTIFVLRRGLERAGLPSGRLAVYVWNPIVITEFAGGGHEEAWAVFWIVAALVALRAERPVRSGLALAAGVLTKLYPLVFIPVFFAARRSWHAATVALATIVLAYLPFVLWIAGPRSPRSFADVLGFLHEFAYRFSFNDSLHEAIGTDGAAIVFGGAVLIAILARRRNARLAGLIFIIELAYLASNPNVYPWYTTIFAAVVPLMPYAFRGAWKPLTLGTLTWSALTPLSYLDRWVLDQGGFADDAAHVVEYVPLYAGVAVALFVLFRYERARTMAAIRDSIRSLVPQVRRHRPTAIAPPRQLALFPRTDLRLDALPNGPRALKGGSENAALPQPRASKPIAHS